MQEDKIICAECNSVYNIDLIIPDELWSRISPKPVSGNKGGGLLCGACIMKKLEDYLQAPFVLYAKTEIKNNQP